MLLQNLHRRYLYIIIKLPHLSDLEQRTPDFPNCDNYGSLHASNPDPLLDDTPTNNNELHQVICNNFKIDYFQEMDVIVTSSVFESKDDPTQMTKAVIYNYILYYIQKTIHSKHICKNVHS